MQYRKNKYNIFWEKEWLTVVESAIILRAKIILNLTTTCKWMLILLNVRKLLL